MKKIVNASNYNPSDYPGEKFTLPSKTVPDMALSLKDLISRYIRGESVQQFNVDYSDEDLSQFQQMDEQDRLMSARHMSDVVENIKGKLADNAKKKREQPPPVQEQIPFPNEEES